MNCVCGFRCFLQDQLSSLPLKIRCPEEIPAWPPHPAGGLERPAGPHDPHGAPTKQVLLIYLQGAPDFTFTWLRCGCSRQACGGFVHQCWRSPFLSLQIFCGCSSSAYLMKTLLKKRSFSSGSAAKLLQTRQEKTPRLSPSAHSLLSSKTKNWKTLVCDQL